MEKRRKIFKRVLVFLAIGVFLGLSLFGIFKLIEFRKSRNFAKLSTEVTVSDRTFIDLSTNRVWLTYDLIKSLLTNAGDVAVATNSLNNNSLQIAKYIGAIYGEDKQKEMFGLLSQNDQTIIDYIEAVKVGNREKKGTALASFSSFSTQEAAFFSSLNPQVSQETLAYYLSNYEATIKTLIDAFAAKDFLAVVSQRQTALDGGKVISSALVNMMSAQHPDKFK